MGWQSILKFLTHRRNKRTTETHMQAEPTAGTFSNLARQVLECGKQQGGVAGTTAGQLRHRKCSDCTLEKCKQAQAIPSQMTLIWQSQEKEEGPVGGNKTPFLHLLLLSSRHCPHLSPGCLLAQTKPQLQISAARTWAHSPCWCWFKEDNRARRSKTLKDHTEGSHWRPESKICAFAGVWWRSTDDAKVRNRTAEAVTRIKSRPSAPQWHVQDPMSLK